MAPTLSHTPKELFDHFIEERLPALRARPFVVAPRGSSENVALLIEPRCHPTLEHVVRNAVHFLGSGWQLQ